MRAAARQSPYRRPVADIVLGIFAILAGLVFCFSGRLWLRIVFPIWGAFAGFSFGAGLIAGLGGDRFLGEVLGWMVGLVFAVLFAVLAYSFYAIAVVIVMTSIGFAIGSGLVVALGIDWNWVAVLVGVLVGARPVRRGDPGRRTDARGDDPQRRRRRDRCRLPA